MHQFTFILGILWSISFPIQSPTTIATEAPTNSFFIPIQQDSTPPVSNKGTVKVKELGNPKKKKQAPKAKKTKTKQVVIKESKPKKTARTNKAAAKEKKVATAKTQKTPVTKPKKERIVKAQKEKAPKKEPKAEVVTKVDTNKTPSTRKNQRGKGLSTEEEIKLLSRTKTIDAENKIHPESAENCYFAFDVIDEFTGVQKRGLSTRSFFAYTPDEYRKFIKEDDFIRCEGFLSQSSEGGMALNINLYVASREAKQKFGAIKANSAMILRTMEGKEYFLMTYPGAEPQVTDNVTYYQCSFAINKSDLKNLQKAEIDQVKISFQKGFQSYDVFYLDFLMDQFPCFEE